MQCGYNVHQLETRLRNDLIYKRYKSIFYGVLSVYCIVCSESVLAMYSFEVFFAILALI
jgi:hypothetical protein